MNKLLSCLLILLALTSCRGIKYQVTGNSSLQSFDGKKLYLKVIQDDEFVSIDSCEVVHGVFSFSGTVDSVQMAMLFMDDTQILPLVLESGNVSVDINEAVQKISGTPLNEKLYVYIDKRTQIENEAAELPHRYSQMIMDGYDEADIQILLSKQQQILVGRMDSLDTHFVKENFDNVLGPGVFMSIVSNNPYPVLTPQLEDILSSAPASFKENATIKKFLDEAEEFTKQMQYVPGQATEQARQEQKTADEKKK